MARCPHAITIALSAVALVTLAAVSPAPAQQFQEQTTTRFPSPNPEDYTNYIAVGDIDNDGDLDLLFANGGDRTGEGPDEQMRVFINDGMGVFTDESATRATGVMGNYRGIALGDVDRDGDLDVLLASDFEKQPRLLINDGMGVLTHDTVRLPVMLLS